MGDVLAVGILYKAPVVIIVVKILVQAVELAQSGVVHILVLLDSGGAQIHVVHKAGVIVSGCGAVPGLTGDLKVAYVAVADHDVVRWCPEQAAVVTSGPAFGSVHETIGLSHIECTVYDEAVKDCSA